MVNEVEEKQFEVPVWDERMQFIRNYFQTISTETEEIAVTANVNIRTGNKRILITYMSVRNKKVYVKSISVDPEIMVIISHHSIMSTLTDILDWFRRDV